MKFDKKLENERLQANLIKDIELYESSVKFMITTVLAIITLGVTFTSPLLLVTNFFVIFLLGERCYYWRNSVVKKGAYIYVFLEGDEEGMHWEEINSMANDEEKKSKVITIEFSKEREVVLLLAINFFVILFKILINGFVLLHTLTIAVSLTLTILFILHFIKEPVAAVVRERWVNIFRQLKNGSIEKIEEQEKGN